MSYTNLTYHVIFSTKQRREMISPEVLNRLRPYIAGIIRELGGVTEAIGTTADHVHILASFRATRCLADIMREIKAGSSGWIHRTIRYRRFGWQDGYGAFTVSRSDVDATKRYIRGQKEHHCKRTFKDEYLDLLRQNSVQFDEKYLW